jgi:hypothetical protein
MTCRILCLMLVLAAAKTSWADVTAQKTDEGVTIEIDGKPFAKYVIQSGAKPIVWPIIGPTGKPMTRAYPMGKDQNEKQDHIHQRSLWFTHGNVNGVDFWAEGEKAGTIKHREFVKVEGGKKAVVATRSDWLAPDGKKVCEDERTLAFGADGDTRWIDFDITVKATEGPVTFGDTKEGTLGVRVADSMKVDAKPGGKIVNSNGQTDKDAWAKQAAWVDYHGPVDGETVGIAILNHPSSFRFPTYWHVRTYGLYAANPFGLRSFKGKENDGSYTLPKGEQVTLRYRILFHRGDEKSGKIAEAFDAYSKEEK